MCLDSRLDLKICGGPEVPRGRRRFGDPDDVDPDFGMRRQAAQAPSQTEAHKAGVRHLPGLQEISENYLAVLANLEKRFSTWNPDDLQSEWLATQQELRAVQEEYALVVEQRLDMEQRQAELVETRQKLLEDLEYWRDAPKRGCSIS